MSPSVTPSDRARVAPRGSTLSGARQLRFTRRPGRPAREQAARASEPERCSMLVKSPRHLPRQTARFAGPPRGHGLLSRGTCGGRTRGPGVGSGGRRRAGDGRPTCGPVCVLLLPGAPLSRPPRPCAALQPCSSLLMGQGRAPGACLAWTAAPPHNEGLSRHRCQPVPLRLSRARCPVCLTTSTQTERGATDGGAAAGRVASLSGVVGMCPRHCPLPGSRQRERRSARRPTWRTVQRLHKRGAGTRRPGPAPAPQRAAGAFPLN